MTTTTSSTSTTSTSLVTSASSTSYYKTGTTGLDTEALIEVAVEAKLTPAYTLEDKITENETIIAAYEDLQTVLTDLEDALDVLRNPDSSSSADDVFASRTTYVTGGGSLTASDYFDVTADDDTQVGTHTVEVQQIATSHKVASTEQTTESDDLGYTSTLTLGLDGGSTVDISVTSDMSLADLAEAINNESETSGVSASIISTSSGSYTLVLAATETGQSITSSYSGTDVLQELGITDSSGAFQDELSTAQSAIVVIDGLTVTRTSNDISDAIDGLTFNLYSAASGTTFDVEVAQDLSAIEDAVEAFVTAYNAYRDYLNTQQETSDTGEASSDAVLFGDSLLRSLNRDVSKLISSSNGGYSLTDLGITLNESNELELDSDTLEDLLLSNPDAIETLFSYQMTASSSDLYLMRRGSELGDASFTLDITVDADGNLSSASINGDSSMFTISGSRIVGAEGTDYEGFTFVWLDDTAGTTSVSVTLSEGIAESLYSLMDTYGNTTDGLVQDAIDTLEDADDDMADRIEIIQERAARFQTYLESKYAAMEAAAATAQALLDQMEAVANANSSD